MEDKKKVGMIATIATTLLCGCPGICLLLYGIIFAMGGGMGKMGLLTSIVLILVGFLMLLLPLGAGGYTFYISRAKPTIEDIDEPIPPAI